MRSSSLVHEKCRSRLTVSTGKQWHQPKKAFRPNSGLTSYAKRAEERKALAAIKAKEKEMKDEKEAERQVGGLEGRGTIASS